MTGAAILYSYFYTVPTTPSGDHHSGGGGGGSSSVVPQTVKTETTISANTATGIVTASATVDSNGKATAAVTQAQMSDAVSKALSAAQKNGNGSAALIKIKVDAVKDAKSIETSIPKAAMTSLTGSKVDGISVTTPIAELSFDKAALSTIIDANGDIKIAVAKVDTAGLSEEAKQLVGDRPVYNFSVTSGGKTISQFGGKVTVSVPYTPKAGEEASAIIIYYINAEGKPEMISNCYYDSTSGTITFTTDHFSTYAVGYNKVSFNDVAANAWYGDAVSFVAARDITTGTGNGNYSPAEKLTRGQFLVMVMRAYGIKADENAKDNFSDAGNTYYTGYLAAAKSLGITDGIGNNMFAPGKEITRQEMFTLLYNTLESIGGLPTGTNGKALTSYQDSDKIASWAKDAMTLFAETGTISGSGEQLNPTDTTNRAQMAQVLYNLLSK